VKETWTGLSDLDKAALRVLLTANLGMLEALEAENKRLEVRIAELEKKISFDIGSCEDITVKNCCFIDGCSEVKAILDHEVPDLVEAVLKTCVRCKRMKGG